MSYTTLLGIAEDYSIIELAEYRNSHLGGSTIWNCYAKYLGLEYIPMFDMTEFWDVWKLKEVPLFEKIVLLSTYDRVYVSKGNLPKLIEAFVQFDKTYENNHIASYMKDIENNKDKLIGVAWHITSITDNPWYNWDEEKEEYIPINIKESEKAWELFDDCLNPFIKKGEKTICN